MRDRPAPESRRNRHHQCPAEGPDAHEQSQGEVTARLLSVVRDLARELQPDRRACLAVHLGSELDRDVGLDSLGRAELLLRLERTFEVWLPEHLISNAVTPNDLLQAVLAARPDAGHRH